MAVNRLQGLDLVRKRQMAQSVRVLVDHGTSLAAGRARTLPGVRCAAIGLVLADIRHANAG